MISRTWLLAFSTAIIVEYRITFFWKVGQMITKTLYEVLDVILPPNCCYNLRKVRYIPAWRVQVWRKDLLDKKGILAPYIQDEIYPLHSEIDDMKADFLRICQKALALNWQLNTKAGRPKMPVCCRFHKSKVVRPPMTSGHYCLTASPVAFWFSERSRASGRDILNKERKCVLWNAKTVNVG